eukprot:31455-Pelagococcus_subviridis.AAC.13
MQRRGQKRRARRRPGPLPSHPPFPEPLERASEPDDRALALALVRLPVLRRARVGAVPRGAAPRARRESRRRARGG